VSGSAEYWEIITTKWRKGTKVGIHRIKKSLLTETTKEPGSCQVRSGTDAPCPRPAAVKIWGISFCEPCAREQEAYFAVGELTEEPRSLRDDEQLVGLLGRMRQPEPERHMIRADEPDAA
jgi:hypothetical protein